MWSPALHRSRALQPTLVAIIAAYVDPLQSIACPRPAPAVVIVGGVDIGHANERKAVEAMMEAVMEEVAAIVECDSRKPGRESSMCKMHASIHAAPVRAAEVRGCEVRTSAAEMHSAATEVPTSEVPTSEAAAMAATASERR